MTDSEPRTKMRRRLWLGGCVAGAVALLGAGIPAVAQALVTPVTYYACVTNSTGAIKIVSASHRCASGQHKISWNNVGPRGPRGIQGIQGIQGPPGVVTGYDSYNSSAVALNGFTLVGTLALPSSNFLVTANTVIYASSSLTANDTAACIMEDGSAKLLDESFTQLDSANGDTYNQETVALTGATTTGGTVQVFCADSLVEASAINTSITAVPVNSVTGSAVKHQAHVRSGIPATRAGR